MRNFVKSLSGFFFFLFGSSYFVAYLLHYNQIGGLWGRWWMDIADLPFALTALLYGGASLYSSITTKDQKSIAAICIIGIPLVAMFCFLLALNFWEALGF